MIRFRRRYDVFDWDGQCAGNLTLRAAEEYARGRKKLLAERGKSTKILIRKQSRNARFLEV
jgi:hypothetical protein